jgi:hypothetical protein
MAEVLLASEHGLRSVKLAVVINDSIVSPESVPSLFYVIYGTKMLKY